MRKIRKASFDIAESGKAGKPFFMEGGGAPLIQAPPRGGKTRAKNRRNETPEHSNPFRADAKSLEGLVQKP